MFARIRRLIRAIFGAWIEKIEDPVLILKQNIRDLSDQVPRMNENIAMIRANVTLLENEKAKMEEKIQTLQAKIKAALRANRRDIALNYATTLEEIQGSLSRITPQIEIAQASFEQALHVKKAFMKEKERKTKEAIMAIREAERAKWQREIAGAMETFEVAGIDSTHHEMVERIEEQEAKDRAHMQLALHSVNDSEIQIEEEVRKLEANEIVRQYERELGIADQPPETPEIRDLATE